MDFYNISTSELEHIIEDYPWYNLARKAYIQKCAGGDNDKIISFVKESSLFVLSRIEFIQAIKGEIGSDFSKKSVEKPAAETIVAPPQDKPKPYIVGGDYFSKEDFQQLSSDGLAINVNFSLPSNAKESPTQDETDNDSNASYDGQSFNEDMFYTETLAEIYANQELYSQAIEIYNKLILLYPEKNAYFASLIENIKNKI